MEISRREFVTYAVSTAALAALPAVASATTQNAPGEAMTTLTPYLLFDGQCHQAMQFYQSCFGGELAATKVKDSTVKDHMPPAQQEKVLNAHLQNGSVEIFASDWLRPDQTPVRGNTVCLYLSGGTFHSCRRCSTNSPPGPRLRTR
jgi:hypothetical protein